MLQTRLQITLSRHQHAMQIGAHILNVWPASVAGGFVPGTKCGGVTGERTAALQVQRMQVVMPCCLSHVLDVHDSIGPIPDLEGEIRLICACGRHEKTACRTFANKRS